MHTFRQLHVVSDRTLGVIHRGLQIAPASREAHRHIALEVLAINERGAFGSLDVRDLRKRNLSTAWNVHADVFDGVQTAPILRQPSHHQIEAPISLEYL